MTPTHTDYLTSATVLWGDAGAFIVNEYQRLNLELFDGQLPPLPMVIGITAYGKCIGLTRYEGAWDAGHLPRITIASNLFAAGTASVSATVLHEMIHAKLCLAEVDTTHNGQPWCDEITRLSPAVIGRNIQAAPVKPKRVNGAVVRYVKDGHLTRRQLAGWPRSVSSAFAGGQVLSVPTY